MIKEEFSDYANHVEWELRGFGFLIRLGNVARIISKEPIELHKMGGGGISLESSRIIIGKSQITIRGDFSALINAFKGVFTALEPL